MPIDNVLSDLHKAHQTGQEKYTYFFFAAAGAAIGFAVQKTEGLALSWWLLPVAVATLLWSASFYFGCRNLNWVQSSLFANYSLLQLRQGSHPKQPSHSQELAIALEVTQTVLTSNGNKAQFYGAWQFRLLVIGAAFFIAWRVIEMARLNAAA